MAVATKEKDMRCIREVGPGVFEVRVHVGRDPYTGKIRQVSRVHRGTLPGARKLRTRLEADVASGKHGGTNGTFGLLLDRWNDHREAIGRSPVTVFNSRRRIERDIRPEFGSMPLDKLTTAHVQMFYDRLTRDGRSWSTRLAIHRDLKGALTYGRHMGWVTTDVMAFVIPPREVPREKTVPGIGQVESLIEAAKATVKATWGADAMIAVAALTGMRNGELCALRFSAVDFTTGVITVRSSVYEVGFKNTGDYRWGVKSPKSGKVRAFKAPDMAIDNIRHRYELLVGAADLLEVDLPDDAYVWWTDDLGEVPVMPRTVTNMFAKLKTREGVNARFHDLRTFAGTEMMARGVDLRTIADRMGHADPSITARIYTTGRAANDDAAARIMDNVLRPGPTAIGT